MEDIIRKISKLNVDEIDDLVDRLSEMKIDQTYNIIKHYVDKYTTERGIRYQSFKMKGDNVIIDTPREVIEFPLAFLMKLAR